MRKSILSAYLMGAIALATTSTFVSCKDYDDDITNLQEQIDANSDALKSTKAALEAEITNLKSQLDATKTELTGLIAKAQKAADDAQAAADKAQAAADKNAADLAAEIARAKAAEQANADAINAEVLRATAKEAALEARIEAAEKALEDLKALVDTKVDQTEFDQAVKDIYAAIAAVDSKVAKNLEKIEALQKGLDDEITARKALAKDLEEQKNALAKLDTRLTTLEGTVKGIQDEIKLMKDAIATAQADIKKLQSDVADNTKAIADIKTDIEQLDARLVKAQTTADTALQAANKALEAAAANKKAIEDEAARAKAAEKAAKDAADAAQKTADKAVADAAAAKAAADAAQATADAAKAAAAQNAADLAAEAARAKAAEAAAQAAAAAAQATADQAKADAAAAMAYAQQVESTLKARIAQAEADIQKAQQAADAAKAAADKAQTAADKAQAAADQALAEIDVLTVYVHHALRSLVLDVNEYWWGVEAVNIKTYSYQNIKVDAPDLTKDQTNDNQTAGATRTGNNASFNATYFLNPSGANVTENVADYSFVNVKDVNYTRAAACGNIAVTAVKKGAGKVDVKGTVQNPSMIKDIVNDGMVTVFALQYNAVDSVITSDWAALRRSVVSNFVINKVSVAGNVDTETAHNHLYTNGRLAVANAPLFEITYDGKDSQTAKGSIDLNEWINVHADIDAVADLLWGGQQTLNKDGFELKYELIGYNPTGAQYNESEYAEINGSVLTAKDPKGNSSKVHMIGHTPLVRVSLINNNDTNADPIALGYFRVLIVGQTNKVTVNIATKINLACGNNNIVIDENILTKQMVEDSLMSATLFENDYKLVVNPQTGAAQQVGTAWGVVTENNPYNNGYLNIKVTNGEAYAAFSTNTKKVVTVQYQNAQGNQTINVNIVITNDKQLVAPTINIVDADKVATSWYEKNSTKTGVDELHAHVNEGTATASQWQFGLDDANWRIGNTVKPLKDVLQNKLGATPTITDVKYSFVVPTPSQVNLATMPGQATISVSQAGDELYATLNGVQETIATLDQTTGVVEWKDAQKSTLAGEVLNYASHKQLGTGETFTARVKVETSVCQPIGNLTSTGNEFDVRFLRPINMSNQNATIVDSNPSTYTQRVAVNFTDWRDWNPNQFASNTGGKDFAAFYGLKSLIQDPNGAVKTNFATGGDTDADFVDIAAPLDSYFKFSMQDINPISGLTNGQLLVNVTYTKLSTVAIHTFKARIPVILEYTWGKMKSYIEVTVQPTTGGNSGVKARK